jgi:GDP-4-dehydro-6-deoxy-D-mannose reductase
VIVRAALITGAGGFCARHLAKRLKAEGGVRIAGLDHVLLTPPWIPAEDYFAVDLRDQAQVETAIRTVQPSWVFHLAGVTKAGGGDIFGANLMGCIYLLEAVAAHAPDARVLLAGSAAEYGAVPRHCLPVSEQRPCRPVGTYAISKYAATLAGLDYAQHLGMRVVVARPFNIVGAGVPPGLVVGALLDRAWQALQSKDEVVVEVGNLDSERDFIAVEDVTEAYIRMVQGCFWGEVFNICSGQAWSIRQIAMSLFSHSPRPIRLAVDPALVVRDEVDISYGSWEKANRAFGFRPTTRLEEALRAAWKDRMETGVPR